MNSLDLDTMVASVMSPPNLVFNGDYGKIREEAGQVADILLSFYDRNKDVPDNYLNGWFEWLTDKGKSMHLKDEFLLFLEKNYFSGFASVLDASRDKEGVPQIRKMLTFLSEEVRDTLISKLEIRTRQGSLRDIYNSEIGTGLEEHLKSRYGRDLIFEHAADFADLLQAGYFLTLDAAKEGHYVVRQLSDFLSSSTPVGENGVQLPHTPSLDAVIALFNAYDAERVVEDVLFNVERHKRFQEINDATKPLLKQPAEYHKTLASTLDGILTDIEKEASTSTYEGSQRILTRLRHHFQELKDFSIEGLEDSLGGYAFPRFYQSETILEIARKKRILVADEMGVGKTAIAVLASRYIGEARDGLKTLVVTTYSNKASFEDKIGQYAPGSNVVVLNGNRRQEQYRDAKEADFVIVNYETLRAKDWKRCDFEAWEIDSEIVDKYSQQLRQSHLFTGRRGEYRDFLLERLPAKIRGLKADAPLDDLLLSYAKIADLNHCKSVCRELESIGFDHVVVDEVQNAKRSTSQNAKALKRITDTAEYVTCLTGTPFVNGLSDLNTIFLTLNIYDSMIADSEERIKSYDDSGDQQKASAERKNLIELRKYIGNGDIKRVLLSNPRMIRDYLRPNMVRRKARDVLYMPDLNIHDVKIRFPIYQRMAYFILENHDFGNASDQLRALQMFTLDPQLYLDRFVASVGNGRGSGGSAPLIPSEILQGIGQEHNAKYDQLYNIIHEAEKKQNPNVLVFISHFKMGVTQELEQKLSSDFQDYTVLRVDGDVVGEERDEVLRRFNTEDKAIIVATLPTLKEAVELQFRCSTEVHLDIPYTWADYSQAVARIWRSGQSEDVDVYNLLISNSLDIGKLGLMQDKRRLGSVLLDGAPLTEQELDLLNMREDQAISTGFFDSYVRNQRRDLNNLMSSLYGKGKDTVRELLGQVNRESEIYADGYILNTLSDASLHFILEAMVAYDSITDTISSDRRILDLGAGYGKLSHATGLNTENLEINPIMIERARAFAPNATYTQGVMQDVRERYGDSQFDDLNCSLAFHYASDEEKARLLFDMHKVLKQDGMLYLTEPESSIDRSGMESLKEALEVTGFEVKEHGLYEHNERNFYAVIAQKKTGGSLYSKPLQLRFSQPEDPDEIKVEMDTRKTLHKDGTK